MKQQRSAAWRVTQKGRAVSLTATNAGDRRIRVASIRIGSGAKIVSFGPGLAGYALGHSAMSWTALCTASCGSAAGTITTSRSGASTRGSSPRRTAVVSTPIGPDGSSISGSSVTGTVPEAATYLFRVSTNAMFTRVVAEKTVAANGIEIPGLDPLLIIGFVDVVQTNPGEAHLVDGRLLLGFGHGESLFTVGSNLA